MERFRLQEMEDQERYRADQSPCTVCCCFCSSDKILCKSLHFRINALVEQEVKRRLFEERVQREKERRMEREREKQEREQELAKIRKAHDKELQRLKEKYEARCVSVDKCL